MALWVWILASVLPVPSSAIFNNVQSGDANVTTQCEEFSMSVIVEVEANFAGKVYAKDHELDCEYTHKSGSTTYRFSFSYDSTGCGQMMTTKDDGSREFSVTTIVRYNTGLLTSEDKSHVSTCTFPDQHSLQTNLGTVNGSESNLAQSDGTADGDSSSQLRFTIETAGDNGGPVLVTTSDQVPLGEELTIKVELSKGAAYDSMLVKNCVASNRKDNISGVYVELELLDDMGCLASDSLDPVVPGQAVYGDTPDKQTFKLVVKAFMFIEGRTGDTNELHFACDVQLCAPGSSSCGRTCNVWTKRRRSVDGAIGVSGVKASGEEVRVQRAADPEPVSVGGGMTVVSAADKTEETHETPADADNCLNNPKIQSILVAMGILLLTLLVVVITLVVLSCRRRGCGGGDKAKQGDEGFSMGSSVQKLTPDYFVKQRA